MWSPPIESNAGMSVPREAVIEEDDEEEDNQMKVQTLLSQIAQLESDLIKERASKQTLKREVERNANNSINNNNNSKASDYHQIEILQLQLEEKDQIIKALNEKRDEDQNYDGFAEQKIELEAKLESLRVENENLNEFIEHQKQAQQKAFEEAVSEQVKAYIDKTENLVAQNDELTLVNEKLQLSYSKLDEAHTLLQNKMMMNDKSEEAKQFWKDHYQTQQELAQTAWSREKQDYEEQIKQLNELVVSLQAQNKINSGVLNENNCIKTQILTTQVFTDSLEYQLKESESRAAKLERETSDRYRELMEYKSRSCVSEAKLIQLQCQLDEMTEQLSRVGQIERDALQVVDENQRLQEILVLKDQELEATRCSLQTEKGAARMALDDLRERCKAQYEKEIKLERGETEKEKKEKAELDSEISNQITKNESLTRIIQQAEEQIQTLEQDKEKLFVMIRNHAVVQQQLQAATQKTEGLEFQLETLLESNNTLNSNLNTRINEIEIWKQRFEKQGEEIKRMNERHQVQINEIHKSTEDELRRAKNRQDETMAIVQGQMSELERDLNEFQIQRVAKESELRKEHRERVDIMSEQNTMLSDQIVHLEKCILELQQRHILENQAKEQQFQDQLDNLRRLLAESHREVQEIKRINQNLTQECSFANQRLSREMTKRPFGMGAAEPLESQEINEPGYFQNNRWNTCGNETPSLRQTIESLREENKQLMIQKYQDYNNYQDHLQSILQDSSAYKLNNTSSQKEELSLLRNPFNSSLVNSQINSNSNKFSNSYQLKTEKPSISVQLKRPSSPDPNPFHRSSSPLSPERYSASKLSEQPNQASAPESIAMKQMQKELEFYMSREESSSKVLEALKFENQKLHDDLQRLEQKYYTRNDWIVDKYEPQEQQSNLGKQKLHTTEESPYEEDEDH